MILYQEYTRAYNAYSAALQLSPVGPSSHVFLSNRAAALLSLKRYNAAATDARRAIALAPTFGKAHARLGQALYFLKDYAGAVAAYEDAIRFQPENEVTQTYLEKAKKKLEKQSRKTRGEEVSVDASSSAMHYTPSVATDTNHTSGIVQGYQAPREALAAAVATKPYAMAIPATEDPDFAEALRIQQRANAYLANKEYKAAIEEYTAALFLVPDDPILSPDLHLGRAHALNGSRRHERAKNDAVLAIKLQPSPAAYSTLAKSLFYMKEYRSAIEAFHRCMEMLPPGESLGMFDKAYLQKAEAALEEEEASLRLAGQVHGGASVMSNRSVVPKLAPPRFVPREEAIQSTPNLPPMPKDWPQQSPRSPSAFKVGPERDVVFLSESLGIKLNRGSDGMVRVLWVAPASASSPVARQGKIDVGDVVREAAGVDLRRPITNIMWGDTVALIKMAPRPITLTVAKELSEVPPAVVDEMKKASSPRPSPSSTDEPVSKEQQHVSLTDAADAVSIPATDNEATLIAAGTAEENVVEQVPADPESAVVGSEETMENDGVETEEPGKAGVDAEKTSDDIAAELPEAKEVVEAQKDHDVVDAGTEPLPEEIGENEAAVQDIHVGETPASLREEEDRIVGGDILFERGSPACYNGWDNLRWLSYSGARKISLCQPCYRLIQSQSKTLFWTKAGSSYEPRMLAIYDDPFLVLILRRPSSAQEVHDLLGLPEIAELDDAEHALESYFVVESVVDPSMSKLRLSALTTPTSLVNGEADERRRSCFELMTPFESILLSVVKTRDEAKRKERSFSDSGAFLETFTVERALVRSLVDAKQPLIEAHEKAKGVGPLGSDLSWKHQIVLGTLHSIVVSGNPKLLDEAIEVAWSRLPDEEKNEARILPTRVIDEADENGLTPLYYACSRKMSHAVSSLVKAGARVDSRVGPLEMTLAHVCARNLDDKSLSTILASSRPLPPDPNAMDSIGRTPMYLAATEGETVDGGSDPLSLGRCIMALEAWGGQMIVPDPLKSLQHPVNVLSSLWKPEELVVILDHIPFRYPLQGDDGNVVEVSLSALYQYPVHAALLSLQGDIGSQKAGANSPESSLVRTLRVLLEHGFEPNERVDRMADFPWLDDFCGYTPIQVLAIAADSAEAKKSAHGEETHQHIKALIRQAASFLVANGARLSVDPPPSFRLRRAGSDSKSDLSDSIHAKQRLTVKLDSNRAVMQMLGGDELLKQAEREWNLFNVVDATKAADLLQDDKTSFSETDAPGGSSDKSCAICWKEFGSLVNRKHKCRVTRRFVCDACSSKRMIREGQEYRITDGQFLLAKVDAARAEKERKTLLAEQDRVKAQMAEKARIQARQERLRAEEESNRTSLFSGMIGKAAAVFGEAEDSEQPAQKVQGLTSSLNQTRDALNERGEKLASLGEKSSQLVDASSDFARMAKELRKKSEGGMFW